MRAMRRFDIGFLSGHLTFLSLASFFFVLQALLIQVGLIRYVDILTTIFILGIFALSFDLLLGYAGLLNFGHALFFGIGAYLATYMLLWTPIHYLAVVPLTALIGMAIGFLISYIVRGAFFGIPFAFTTLAISLIVYFLYRKRELLPISGGEQGLIVPLPEIIRSPELSTFFFVLSAALLALLMLSAFIRLRSLGRSSLSVGRVSILLSLAVLIGLAIFIMSGNLVRLYTAPPSLRITPNFYFFALTALCICYLLARRFVNSPVGRVWVAIRENDARAEVLGFNVFRYKSLALSVSGGFAALAGAIYAPSRFVVSPDGVFTPLLTVYVLVYVILGGLGTLNGALLGTGIVVLLERFLIDYVGGWGPVVIGGIFIACVLGLPYGLVHALKMKGLSTGIVVQMLFRLIWRR